MDVFDVFIGISAFVLICVVFTPAKSKDDNSKN